MPERERPIASRADGWAQRSEEGGPLLSMIEDLTEVLGKIADPACANSSMIGVIVISFWEGGRVPDGQIETQATLSDAMLPAGCAPYVRAIADSFEDRNVEEPIIEGAEALLRRAAEES